MPAAGLGLLNYGNRNLAEPFERLRVIGQKIEQAVGAGKARGAAADDRHANVDPLVLGIEFALDELCRRVNRWRV